jgi:hypothetical protein
LEVEKVSDISVLGRAIEAAAKSDRGILALMVTAVSAFALRYFRNDPLWARVFIFLLLLSGTMGFAWATYETRAGIAEDVSVPEPRLDDELVSGPAMPPNSRTARTDPPSAATEETVVDNHEAEASGQVNHSPTSNPEPEEQAVDGTTAPATISKARAVFNTTSEKGPDIWLRARMTCAGTTVIKKTDELPLGLFEKGSVRAVSLTPEPNVQPMQLRECVAEFFTPGLFHLDAWSGHVAIVFTDSNSKEMSLDCGDFDRGAKNNEWTSDCVSP